MANIVTFLDAAGATQEIRFDVSTAHTHEFSQTVTDSSVEDGADISDHATVNLDRVQLSVFSSNQPIREDADPSGRVSNFDVNIPKYREFEIPQGVQPVSQVIAGLNGQITKGINTLLSAGQQETFRLLTFDQGLNRPRDLYDAFKELALTTTLCRVLTSVHDYDNMLIVNVNGFRNTDTGDGTQFELGFREIRIANTEVGVVAVDVSIIRANRTESLGSKSSSEASSGSKSILAGIQDSI